MQQRARNRQTTQLTARELTTAFTQPAVQAIVFKQLMQPDLLQHGAEYVISGLRCSQQQVIAQRGAEEMNALRNHADGFAQRLFAEVCQRSSVKLNLTLLWIPGSR